MFAEVDWTQVFVAVAVGLPATITAAGAVYMSWRNAKKIDDNTTITKAGTTAATVNAKIAANSANEASDKANALAAQLNGAMDVRISSIVKTHLEPVQSLIKDHIEQDERNMAEIRTALNNLHTKVTPAGMKN